VYIAKRSPSQKLDNMEFKQDKAVSEHSIHEFRTLQSLEGHDIQIPVDGPSGAGVTEERRMRNPGAAARFRARRKQKEQETLIQIESLQQQLREASENIEYYRKERDFFRSVVAQQQGSALMSRPPSPGSRQGGKEPEALHVTPDANETWTHSMYKQLVLFKADSSWEDWVIRDLDSSQQRTLQGLAHELGLQYEYFLASGMARVSQPGASIWKLLPPVCAATDMTSIANERSSHGRSCATPSSMHSRGSSCEGDYVFVVHP
jgi:hypothetical protein